MKHKGLFWGIMGISFVVGCVLVALGVAMGGTLGNVSDFWDLGEEDSVQIEENIMDDTEIMKSFEDINVKNLDFDLSACDVTIIEGDQFSVSGSKIESSFREDEDGQTWYLRSPKRKWYHWLTNRAGGEWTITLPRDHQFETVNINFAAADMDIEKLSAKTLTLKGGAGDATIEKLTVSESVNLTVGAGEIDVVSGDITGTSRIKCGAGEMSLNLTRLAGEMTADCGMGEIDFVLPGAREDYSISTKTGMGSIDVDGESGKRLATDGNTLATLDLTCGMGEIQVDFE